MAFNPRNIPAPSTMTAPVVYTNPTTYYYPAPTTSSYTLPATSYPVPESYTPPSSATTFPTADSALAPTPVAPTPISTAPAPTAEPTPVAPASVPPSLASLVAMVGGDGGASVGGGAATIDTSADDSAGLSAAQDSPGRLSNASLLALRSILDDPNFTDNDTESFGIRDRVGVRHGQAIQQARRNFQLSRSIPRAGGTRRGQAGAAPQQESTDKRRMAGSRGASGEAPAADQASMQQMQRTQQLSNLRLALGL